MNKIKTLLIILIAGFVNSANVSAAARLQDEEARRYVRIIGFEAKAAIAEFDGKINAQLGFTNLTSSEIQSAVNVFDKTSRKITLGGVIYTTDNCSYKYINTQILSSINLFSSVKKGELKGCMYKTKNYLVIGISEKSTQPDVIRDVIYPADGIAITMFKQGK